jgi:predicted lipoprotein
MGESDSRGFSAALSDDDERSTGLAASIDEHFRYGIGIVEARTAALAQEVTTQGGREFVGFLIVHVDTIRDLILQIFPRALGVTAGFNALDGD